MLRYIKSVAVAGVVGAAAALPPMKWRLCTFKSSLETLVIAGI